MELFKGPIMLSQKIKQQANIFTAVIHGKATGQVHRELHQLSHIFYKSTVVVRVSMNKRIEAISSMQHAVECEKDEGEQKCPTKEPRNRSSDRESHIQCSLSVVSSRRKIEVPDEDSSFLLRGQVSLFRSIC